MFENIINHKRYIGQTIKNYKERWTEHYNAKDTFYFHNALRKYGWESFSKYILVQTKEFKNTPENLIKIQKALDQNKQSGRSTEKYEKWLTIIQSFYSDTFLS